MNNLYSQGGMDGLEVSVVIIDFVIRYLSSVRRDEPVLKIHYDFPLPKILYSLGFTDDGTRIFSTRRQSLIHSWQSFGKLSEVIQDQIMHISIHSLQVPTTLAVNRQAKGGDSLLASLLQGHFGIL